MYKIMYVQIQKVEQCREFYEVIIFTLYFYVVFVNQILAKNNFNVSFVLKCQNFFWGTFHIKSEISNLSIKL